MSWLNVAADGSILNTIAAISYSVTEPVFATVRRAMPRFGDLPIDLSPMVVMLALGMLQGLVCRVSG